MKKYLTFIVCLVMAVNLIAQEKYPVPVRTSDQKLARMAYQYWTLTAAGINFAKTHGVTPYDYGKFMGNLFAPTWGAGNNFEGFIKGMIGNFESMRLISDPAIVVKEDNDGSVRISTNDKIYHRYFPDGKGYATYDEFREYFRGLSEPLADHMGAKVLIEVQDTMMVFTIKKK